MLIICAGSDTYRAREKARELEVGFRQKYDPDGLAVEKVLINVKEHVKDRLYPLLSAGSLFSSRKFIRADGCLGIFKAVDRKKCLKRLSETDQETIVISVEENEPSKKALEAISKESVVVYAHPVMKTGEFFKDKKQSQVKSYIKRKLESKEDWWMSSEDSIKYGFCDHIVGEKGLETIDRIVKNASRILQL